MLTAEVLSRLTVMERRILEMLPSGAQNKEIANALGMVEGTVKVHLKAILKKIGARNRTVAAVLVLTMPDSRWLREREEAFQEAVAMAIEFAKPLVLQGGLAAPHEPPHLRVIDGSA